MNASIIKDAPKGAIIGFEQLIKTPTEKALEIPGSIVDITAALTDVLYSYVRTLRQAIVDARPKARQKEWKLFTQLLRMLIEKHEQNKCYKTTAEDRERLQEYVDTIQAETATTMSLLYFNVRNDIINMDYDETEVEPLCQARITEVVLNAYSEFRTHMGCDGINRTHDELRNILRMFTGPLPDKQKHQQLCKTMYTRALDKIRCA